MFTIVRYRHTAISCPWFFPSLFFSVQAKNWLIITHNTMQQLSGALWGGSSMEERGPTHKHSVLGLWILATALPCSAYFAHMTLIKMSRGLTHLLWGQSVITSIGAGSPTHAFKWHKYFHVPPQSLCNKVITFRWERLTHEACLSKIFSLLHIRSIPHFGVMKRSLLDRERQSWDVSHTFSALWVRHCTFRSSCSA